MPRTHAASPAFALHHQYASVRPGERTKYVLPSASVCQVEINSRACGRSRCNTAAVLPALTVSAARLLGHGCKQAATACVEWAY
eukprot:16605-Pleurochrysis_carterae.AAC.1